MTTELRGQLLGGRYRIGGVIGRGGMGTVYEAVQESLGRPVAVKVLHPALAQDADTVARFRHEAERAGALSHPHIVHVLDFGSEPGGPAWIAMERLEGESLGQRLGRLGALDESMVVPIALETLSALQAAHEARLVHRDLKPDNIFLARAAGVGQVVKVLDFGIAKLLDGSAAQALTASGMIVGTPLYMSPEQAQGRVVDGRADVYSLGAVLFEALTGKPPIVADSYTALLIAIVTEPVPPLLSRRPDVDPRLAAAVDRAVSKDPAARFASAREMADALRDVPLTPRPAVVATEKTELELAKTVEGAATPEVAAPPAPGRRPLVKLRWPRKPMIGTLLVVVLAGFFSLMVVPTFTMVGSAPEPVTAEPQSGVIPTMPTMPAVPAVPGVPSNPQPFEPVSPPARVHIGVERITSASDAGLFRRTLVGRDDLERCWTGAPPDRPVRGPCLEVTLSRGGDVERALPRARSDDEVARCIASRLAISSFAVPPGHRPETFTVCFSIEPQPAP